MRTPWIALLASVFFIACAGSGADGNAEPATSVAPTVPAPSAPAAPAVDAGADANPSAAPDTAAPKNDCALGALPAVPDITPTFVMKAPPAMTGGTLAGDFRADTATVFLPAGASGLVDATRSTGTINGWAVFDGTNYRLALDASLVIATVAGPQTQGLDSASQGGFTASGAVLKLDHACDAAIPDEADYSFTSTGDGRATILIATPTPYGNTYLLLEGTTS